MPTLRVRVVASYAPTERSPIGFPSTVHSDDVVTIVWDLAIHPPDVIDLLIHEGAVDATTITDPPLLVLTILYDVDAPDEQDARFDAIALFEKLAAERELPYAESVIAHIDDE